MSPRSAVLGCALVAVFLLVLLPAGPSPAQCTQVETNGAKWCGTTSIPYYWGPGLNGSCSIISNRACWEFRNSIQAAITEWNATMAADLDTPLNLYFAGSTGDPGSLGSGIVFSLGDLQLGTYPNCSPGIGGSGETSSCGGTVPPGRHFGWTHYDYSIPGSGSLAHLEKACIHFADPSDVNWVNGAGSGIDRKSVALHEIGHALGLGHGDGAGCLMQPGSFGGCNETLSIDGVTMQAMACLYGSLFISCSPSWAIVPYTGPSGSPQFLFGYCDCSGSCAAKSAAAQSYAYELAVSEAGGPYSVFANLSEGDWTNRSYEHAFSQSYSEAMIRMRVFDGGTQIGETHSTYPIAIEATATATPAISGGGLVVTSAPNPASSRSVISFELDRPAEVELSVYDAAGRRVATVQRGGLDRGFNQVHWSGRLDDGTLAASGVYRYVVRAGGRSASGKIVWVK